MIPITIAAVAVLASAAGMAHAAGIGAGEPAVGVLSLRTGDVAVAALADVLSADAPLTGRYVLVLDGPMTPDRAAALAAAGVTLGEYLPTNAFVSSLAGVSPRTLRGLGFVASAVAFRPAWKIAPELGAGAYVTPERLALAAQGRAASIVRLFAGEPLDPARAALDAIPGVEIQSASFEGDAWVMHATMPIAAADAAASLDQVQLIEDAPEFTPRNNTVRWIVQTNLAMQTPFYTRGLTGVGQIVGVIDGAVNPNHCSFSDNDNPIGDSHRKIHRYNAAIGSNDHGTHVAGIVVGDAGADNDLRGVAYGARMVYHTYPSFGESNVFGRFDLHRTQGAVVHNNSWGSDATNAYDSTCRAIDNFSWLYDTHLLVFSVSNGSLIRNPENAKNCLAVIASGDAGSQANWCYGGRGPTADSRRKPEIAAPGCTIASADNTTSCQARLFSGTSMAAPAISGAAAILRQYFIDGYYPSGSPHAPDAFEPTGALLKAMLVNSAVDMTGVSGFPSDREGWGRVLLDNAAYFTGDPHALRVHQQRNNQPGALVTGGLWQTRIRIPAGAAGIKITLAWHDAPASVNAALAPVNDLDLSAHLLDGTAFLGNVFAGGRSNSGGTPDSRNNLEQVLLTSPAEGSMLIRGAAPAVQVGSQGFALVITGNFEPLCPADFNGDAFADYFDLDDYIAAFEAGSALADMNDDGFVDFFDYDDFITAFEAGC